MTTKVINKTKKTSKNLSRRKTVRLVIDERLELEIQKIQHTFPLFSTAEAIKAILSRGIQESQPSMRNLLEDLKKTRPITQNLIEAEIFERWQQFNNSL